MLTLSENKIVRLIYNLIVLCLVPVVALQRVDAFFFEEEAPLSDRVWCYGFILVIVSVALYTFHSIK